MNVYLLVLKKNFVIKMVPVNLNTRYIYYMQNIS